MLWLNMFMLTFLIVFVVDISGFVNTLKMQLWSFLKGRGVSYRDFPLKPFDCSLCMTWWAGLLYIIMTGCFSLGSICIVALMALMTDVIYEFVMTIKDLLIRMLRWINR